MFQRHPTRDHTPDEIASLYLAADEARWLAEERGLASYWEVARVLGEALPGDVAESLEFCWVHAGVLPQAAEDDAGYYRRLACHAGYLRQSHPEIHAALEALVGPLREARACAAVSD